MKRRCSPLPMAADKLTLLRRRIALRIGKTVARSASGIETSLKEASIASSGLALATTPPVE